MSQGPSLQNQIAIEAAAQIGNAIGQMLRGDPQQAARQKAEAEARAFEQQRIAAENDRRKQAAFARLSSVLKLGDFDGDKGGSLLLKGVDVDASAGHSPLLADPGNRLGLKLGDDDLTPNGTQAAVNTGAPDALTPNTDPMVVDLRKAPESSPNNSGGRLGLKLGDDEVQPQVTQSEEMTEAQPSPEQAAAPQRAIAQLPVNYDEAAFALEEVSASPRANETKTESAPAATGVTVAVDSAAAKTIEILDRTVDSVLESLKTSQSGQPIEIGNDLSRIKAVLSIPPSGKKGDHTVRTISIGHQQSGKSGDKQHVGQILVTRNEETGEVHIDVMQEQAGKAAKQSLIHLDRSGNIIAQESR